MLAFTDSEIWLNGNIRFRPPAGRPAAGPAAPAGRPGRPAAKAGRHGRPAAPAGRPGRPAAPAGRPGRLAAPAGRPGRPAAWPPGRRLTETGCCQKRRFENIIFLQIHKNWVHLWI